MHGRIFCSLPSVGCWVIALFLWSGLVGLVMAAAGWTAAGFKGGRLVDTGWLVDYLLDWVVVVGGADEVPEDVSRWL